MSKPLALPRPSIDDHKPPVSPTIRAQRVLMMIRTSPRRALYYCLLCLSALFVFKSLLSYTNSARIHAEIEAMLHAKFNGNPNNWGDHIARGSGRNQMLAKTPVDYPGLGDNWDARVWLAQVGSYSKVRAANARKRKEEQQKLEEEAESRRKRQGSEDEPMMEGDEMQAARQKAPSNQVSPVGALQNAVKQSSEFEFERHGMYGGSHLDWESGIVGLGDYLGPLDMRKASSIAQPSESLPVADESSTPLLDVADLGKMSRSLNAAVNHHLENAWEFAKAKDKLDNDKLMELARKQPEIIPGLPLKERVRLSDDVQQAKHDAAQLWTRIYGAYEHDKGVKSALQIEVEKVVRRAPVVVFSKSTCPYSAKAKSFLKTLKLSPPPVIVEVDLRPDGTSLKALLTRLTNHSTFPNVIIGGKSIGGWDDLSALSELKYMLKDLGVTFKD